MKLITYNFLILIHSTLKLDPSSKKILTIITDYTLFHLQNIEINKLIELADLSKSTVSNKIGILEKTGYIIRHREGKQTTYIFSTISNPTFINVLLSKRVISIKAKRL